MWMLLSVADDISFKYFLEKWLWGGCDQLRFPDQVSQVEIKRYESIEPVGQQNRIDCRNHKIKVHHRRCKTYPLQRNLIQHWKYSGNAASYWEKRYIRSMSNTGRIYQIRTNPRIQIKILPIAGDYRGSLIKTIYQWNTGCKTKVQPIKGNHWRHERILSTL